jgi:hypothetical protein
MNVYILWTGKYIGQVQGPEKLGESGEDRRHPASPTRQ